MEVYRFKLQIFQVRFVGFNERKEVVSYQALLFLSFVRLEKDECFYLTEGYCPVRTFVSD